MGRLAEYQRKQLEQLMGAEAMGLEVSKVTFWDLTVCRDDLCGTCPHDLFGNTKMDLGPCPKVHSAKLKSDFEEALKKAESDYTAFFFEHERRIRDYVDANDRSVRAAMKRLEMTPEEKEKTRVLLGELAEIDAAIKATLTNIEALGEEGEVEKAQEEQAKLDALKGEKDEKEREISYLNDSAGASGKQRLKVCEICSKNLSVLDSDKRLADHYAGKLHIGFAQLRATLKEFADQGGPVPVWARKGMGANRRTTKPGPLPTGPAASSSQSRDSPIDSPKVEPVRREPRDRERGERGERGERERERERDRDRDRDRGERRRRSRSRSPRRH